jgi:hypothetical protein
MSKPEPTAPLGVAIPPLPVSKPRLYRKPLAEGGFWRGLFFGPPKDLLK